MPWSCCASMHDEGCGNDAGSPSRCLMRFVGGHDEVKRCTGASKGKLENMYEYTVKLPCKRRRSGFSAKKMPKIIFFTECNACTATRAGARQRGGRVGRGGSQRPKQAIAGRVPGFRVFTPAIWFSALEPGHFLAAALGAAALRRMWVNWRARRWLLRCCPAQYS
jgi:hypothetical protein